MRKSILFPTFLGKEAIYDGPTSLTFVLVKLSEIYSHHTYAEAFMIIDGGCLSDLLRICTLKRDAKSKILRSNLGKKIMLRDRDIYRFMPISRGFDHK